MSSSPLGPPPPHRFRTDAAPASPTASQSMTEGPAVIEGPPPAVRAQLLATEHWSLLATRSMAQGEVLSRISMFLTLVSASIVSLALIGQVTRFDQRFVTFALVLIAIVVLVGTLTQMRVGYASMEDLAHVIGMNRLRAGYLDIDPTIARYLVTSAHDDDRGLWQTYNHLIGPNTRMQPLASSGAFLVFLNSGLTAVFAGLVAMAVDAPVPLVAAATAAGGVAFLGTSALLGMRQFQRVRERYVSRFPSDDIAGAGHDKREP